jgi:formate dehydrogenase iron-sulfur subunit
VPAGWADVAGSGRAFELEVRLGAGAYVCGEETAMLESLEGKRGVVRFKPPLPAIQGLFGKPTVINNVMSLAAVPLILARGAAFYRDYGMGRSRHLPFQLAGNMRHGAGGEGLRHHPARAAAGLRRRHGQRAADPRRAGGRPLGAFVPESQFDVPLDYEAYAAMGAMIGHGGWWCSTTAPTWPGWPVMPWSSAPRILRQVHALPHRLHPRRRGDRPDHRRRHRPPTWPARDLCDTMLHGSLCAMGGMTPYPVRRR